jgi:hypothetical protein
MTTILVAWAASALALLALAMTLGMRLRPSRGPLGILIDARGRYSLTHLQIVVWSIVVLSLVSGLFWGRLVDGVPDPLGFSIPDQVLGLLGISAGSAVTAMAVKAGKDATPTGRSRVAASSMALDPPRFSQVFLMEEGACADHVIDVTKFQNFIITLTLVVAYVAMGVDMIARADRPAQLTALPTFSGTLLALLGISHGAYVAGKLPSQAGTPPGLTMENRRESAEQLSARGFTPRNASD